MSHPLHNIAPPGSLEAKDLEHLLHPSTNLKQLHERGPFIFHRAEGVYVYDQGGKQYLEGMAGLWCTSLGYGNERLIRVATEQMRQLSYTHLFGGKSHEPAILLAEKLKAMMPFQGDRVFFGLSGSDANDTQIKLIWYYNNAIGRTQKKKILSRLRGYHGITLAAASLTGLPAQHINFDLPLPQVKHLSCPHFYRNGQPGESETQFVDRLINELENKIAEEGAETIAAFIAEPVMGAGGVIPPPTDYLGRVAHVLKKNDILFIADEVITGFGRTGKPFGCETYGVKPDTMTIAKALSSAYLPISATIIPEYMYEPMVDESGRIGNFGHGYTYSGHPVCAALALETLRIYEELDLFNQAAQRAVAFQARLQRLGEHSLVGEARGVGLIGGVELVANKSTKAAFPSKQAVGAYCVERCQAHGLVLRNLGDTVAICPPLVISDAQVQELFDKLEKALDETRAWAAAA